MRFVTIAALIMINAGSLVCANAEARADAVELDLSNHRFVPPSITVPANTKFQIKVTNHDDTPAEFESHDLKVEKIVVPGSSITVTAGPLKPGTYQFFDDYHPDDAKGDVTAKE